MVKTIIGLIKQHFFLTTFLLFYFLALSFKLITHPTPLYDWDEAIYTQVGREMIDNKSIVPLWQGKFWLDKPPIVPLFYGLIEKLSFNIPPEISLRMATLTVSIFTLILIYILYLKILKDKALTALVVALTSFVPIFMQRSQAVNIDVFLLLGWVGYVIFFENFWFGLFFLTLSVLSKSLVGFYPAVIVFIYFIVQFLLKKITVEQLKKAFFRIFVQVFILSLWYIANFLFFGQSFLLQHIIETHFRRVTASIEFHFGRRTFYLELILQQFGNIVLFSVLGGILFIKKYFRKEIDGQALLYGFYLLPWFFFLNLTKTKIFWYAYPAIPQFAFLLLYPVSYLKKYKIIYIAVLIIILGFIVNVNFIRKDFFAEYYSSFEPHYYLSLFVKDNCRDLNVAVDPQTRKDFATLDDMRLLITTSKWWGNHPAIVYYSGKKVNFLYTVDELSSAISELKIGSCLAVNKDDLKLVKTQKKLQEIKSFGDYHLFKNF